MIIFISSPLASVSFLNWPAVLNEKQDDQSFLFLIMTYKVLTASGMTSTIVSYKIYLPKFVKSTTKVSLKLENSICTWMFLTVSSNKSQGERNKKAFTEIKSSA